MASSFAAANSVKKNRGWLSSEKSDTIARVHAERMETVRHLVGEPVELGVCPPLVSEDERDVVRVELGPPAEREAETLVIRHRRKPSDCPLRLIAILPFASGERFV